MKDFINMHFFYSQTDCDSADSEILQEFSFINDFGFEEYKDIRQKPLSLHFNRGIEICFVTKGRYEWVVGGQNYILFPGDGFITCPWQKHGSPREVVDLGEIYWMVIKPDIFEKNGKFYLGNWSRFTSEENKMIGEVLSRNKKHKLQKVQVFRDLFERFQQELTTKKFGYYQRVCNIVEEFLIQAVRIIQNRENQIIDNQNWFYNFDRQIKSDISKKWSLKEMAGLGSVCITTLTQLLKEHTGYTPANYLIFLRLEKAKKVLENSSMNLTKIALDCGFYSSQHFSSTFSKWIGITPSVYRKKNKKK